MKVLVKLFYTGEAASDGSIIPRSVCQEYLNSTEYKEAIERGLMTGNITHADRCLASRPNGDLLKGVVGKDDSALLNRTCISVIEKIFLSEDPGDNWVYAIQRFFNPEVMDKDSAESIKHITGLIKNGVKVTTSAVVIGYWDENERCEKLVSIRGNDVTLNPAFKKSNGDSAGVLKILED